MSSAHKGHAPHYKHIEWYIQIVALRVKTCVVILFWGVPNLPLPFFKSSHICSTLFCICIYIYIYV